MKYTEEKELEIRNRFSTEFYGVACRDVDSDMLFYADADDGTVYIVDFLSDDEVTKLMEKSLKDGVNYLYEKVKDYECID